jgi:hypothetical protein
MVQLKQNEKTKFEIADANSRKLFKEYCNTQMLV